MLRFIPWVLSTSCASRLQILLKLLIYVGVDMKVILPFIELITLMVYEIHITE